MPLSGTVVKASRLNWGGFFIFSPNESSKSLIIETSPIRVCIIPKRRPIAVESKIKLQKNDLFFQQTCLSVLSIKWLFCLIN